MATLKTAADYAAELGRTQKAYQEYAGRKDLQKNTNAYADKLKAQAQAAGVDLSGYGTKNKYGTDYTSYYAGSSAGVYDPSKAGIVQKTDPKVDTGTGTGTGDGITGIASGIVSGTGTTNTPAQNYIDELTAARKRNAVAGLERSKNSALSNLDAEKTTIQPRYYDAKNQAAAGSQQSARNFAEYMAARGGASSGSNAQAELSRSMNLQGSLGALGQQETAAFGDIARRTTDVNNAYSSDVAAAESGADAERLSALLNDYYVAQQRGDNMAQLAIQNELAKAGLTGYLKGDRTLAGQAHDLNSTQVMASLTGYLPNGQKTSAQQQMDLENLWKVADNSGVIPDQIATMYGIPKGTPTQAARQFAMSYNLQNRQVSSSINNANADNTRAASVAEFNRLMDVWKGTGQAPDGIAGVSAGTPWGGAAANQNSYESQIMSGLTKFDNANAALGWLNENAGEITSKLGSGGFEKFQKLLPSIFVQNNKNTSAIRQKAVDAAMKDIRWNDGKTDHKTLIDEFMNYLQS